MSTLVPHRDTAGQEDYDRLRPLSYPQTDVFLVCFSAVDRTSMANVKNKWLTEIRHHCPTAPVLLVATKIDLRNDASTLAMMRDKSNQGPITSEEVSAFAKEVAADGAVECSARTQEGLARAFDDAIRLALDPPDRSGKGKGRKDSGKAKKCSLF
jgi:small GTP-binding protein